MRKQALTALVIGLLFIPSYSLTALDSDEIIIYFDCGKITSSISSFTQINCGPLPNQDVQDGSDLTRQYQEFAIDFVRTHDFSGPTDISTLFPDFSKDPSLESSYNFTQTDRYISAIIDADCEVFFRIGESASGDKSLRQPPKDYEKWAEICKHVLMHYNDGWADGFSYNIIYIEIWNEPDLKGFFNGTAEQYYQLFETTVFTLKSYNSDLKVGGPCTSSIFNENFTTGFLDYLRNHDIPLDFFSWHMYADYPGQIYQASRFIRMLLDSYGFTECENINTEWNINIIYPQRDKDNAKNAAFTACTLSLLQDAGIDKAFRYRGTGDANWLAQFIGFDLSLFTYDGQYKTPGLIYKIMSLFQKDMPKRLESSANFSDTNITYLAGISDTGDRIGVMISNYEQDSFQYSIQLDNISWSGAYTITIYDIDDDHDFAITDQIMANGSSIKVSSFLEKNSVQFIYLTNTSNVPDEGPVVYDIPWLLQLRFLDPIRALLGVALILIIFG